VAFYLHVNGRMHLVDDDSETPSLRALRDSPDLTDTKYGCGVAQCGAGTVHLDGRPMRSCPPLEIAAASRLSLRPQRCVA
jgi:isoquinoline 1-oxidoreductase alpha subunit